MAKKEVKTDLWVARQLDDSQIKYDAQGSNVKEINDALQSASKRGTGKVGYPEYVAVVKDFVIVIEDKADLTKHQKLTDAGILSVDQKDIANYAVNGAYFYAKHIAQNSAFHKIFAIGVAGDEKHHKITPLYVDDREGYKVLPDIESFTSFTVANIEEYYTRYVLSEKTDVEKTTEEILKDAAELHEYLRTYGSLKDQDKPLVVSGILLALDDKFFKPSDLLGDETTTDGQLIYDAIQRRLKASNVGPDAKRDKLMSEFSIIRTSARLNEIDQKLGKTPLKFYTEFLKKIQVRANGTKFCRTDDDGDHWGNTSDDYEQQFVSVILDSVFFPNNYKSQDEYLIFEYALRYKYLDSLCSQYINEEHVGPLISRFENRVKRVKRLFKICDNPPADWLAIYSLVDVNVEFKKIVPLIICKYFYERQRLNFNGSSLHIIIDEAHNVLSTTSERESQTWKDYRLETFEEIIKEGRKFGTFLTISSQRPSDISETIISQLHNYFIHRLVNNEDIRAIGKAVAFIDNTSYEMISVLPQGACIFTGVASNFPVLVQVDLLPKQQQPQSSTINLTELWKEP